RRAHHLDDREPDRPLLPGRPAAHRRRRADDRAVGVPGGADGLLHVDDPQGLEGAAGVSDVAAQPRQRSQAAGFRWWQRLRGWLGNPWGKPRFLVLVTWGYVVWSIAPVLIAIQFSFNNSRSLGVWHGFSTRWYWGDPIDSVWHSAELRGALNQSLKL